MTLSGGSTGNSGGAIFIASSADALTITRSTLNGNQSDQEGGAISSGGPVNITDSTISANRTTGLAAVVFL